MVYDYLITLKKPEYRWVDMVSRLMYLLALVAFSYFYTLNRERGTLYIFLVVGIIAAWIYTYYKKRKEGEASYRFGLFLGAAGWFVGIESNLFIGALYAVAGLLEKQVKFPREIGFNEDEIIINSLPKKSIAWSDLNNVIIKDGLLTIDKKNNIIFQKEIEGQVSTSLEKEFNEFCAKCLSSAHNANINTSVSTDINPNTAY